MGDFGGQIGLWLGKNQPGFWSTQLRYNTLGLSVLTCFEIAMLIWRLSYETYMHKRMLYLQRIDAERKARQI